MCQGGSAFQCRHESRTQLLRLPPPSSVTSLTSSRWLDSAARLLPFGRASIALRGRSPSRVAAASRAVLSRATRASNSGSRSQRGARGKRGSSASGTASPRATAARSSVPLRSRTPRGTPLIAPELRARSRLLPSDLEHGFVADDAEGGAVELCGARLAPREQLAHHGQLATLEVARALHLQERRSPAPPARTARSPAARTPPRAHAQPFLLDERRTQLVAQVEEVARILRRVVEHARR